MRALFERKAVKIGATATIILAVLVVAFFFAPGVQESAEIMPAIASSAEYESTIAQQSEQDIFLDFSMPSLPSLELYDVSAYTQTEQSQIVAQSTQVATTTQTTTSPAQTDSANAASSATTTRATAASAPTTTTIRSTTTRVTFVNQNTTTSATTTVPVTTIIATTTTNQQVVAPPPVQPAQLAATMSIRCDVVLNNMHMLRPGRNPPIPSNGIIMAPATVVFTQGETAFDVLRRETRARGIHMEFTHNPMFNSAYIRGINNLYEFDFGELSGWMYKINGQFPGFGSSQYTLRQGDVIEWVYVLDFVG